MKRRQRRTVRIASEFARKERAVLHQGDAYSFVRTLPSKFASLIVTSPPYNVGKSYEKRRPLEEYLQDHGSVIEELVRVLKDDGSICWQVGNYAKNGEVIPLDIHFYGEFKRRGLKLRNRIVWQFGHGLHASRRFSGRYETILWFTKTDEYVFNIDPVRVPAKYPGKTYHKGPRKGELSGNRLGKNPSDVWKVLSKDWHSAVWDIPNVKANHPEKTVHPCQFPIELVERCVLALTKKGDWVLDPYAGTGSSLIAALKNRRKGVGCEKEKEYVTLAKNRIKQLTVGKLKMRRLGAPVYEPSGREKVAQYPSAWSRRPIRDNPYRSGRLQ